MCPFCKDNTCKIVEQPSGRLVCECGKHSWPNSGAYDEACRKARQLQSSGFSLVSVSIYPRV